MGVMLALVLVWGSLRLLLPAMLLFGMAMSLFDVAINTKGTALESLSGRTVMSNLHAMFSVGAMAGAALTGALLRARVDPRVQLAAIGYAAFTAAMAMARFGGDALRARYSERNLLRASAGLSAVAMAVVLLSGDAAVSIVGYALVGAGLAPVVPILFNAATRVPGTSRAAAIAAVSSIGYLGFMIGPPLIGGLAQALSLTAAMWIVVLASALLANGARKVG
jgi:predicted MFS family arabinose efflux permease